ncbi:hypothetical protein CROQUDRAFT_94036 [Cronartium quercuum f. sp. fusiforme G11]|uniref:Uncharacterized protein n=1 Tax=Cronartium quercuum f. sp. fusiforme G11 TaxID=708437 RepID=A0A9P6NGR7_9BASI|nr:hypothetical protein CROQUDRAFT_94036 [Cronartium quercuum f. sp. fusiforme G11]
MLYSALPVFVFVTLITNAAAAGSSSPEPKHCSMYANADSIEAHGDQQLTFGGQEQNRLPW